MKKGSVALVVLAMLVALFLVLSIDGAPPDDSHLALVEGPVPPDQNGFEILLDAVAAVEWPEDESWIEDHLTGERTDEARARDLVERNRVALAGLDDAIAAPHFRTEEKEISSSYFLQTQRLRILCALRSVSQFGDGRESDALESLFQILELGERFQRTGMMMGYLVGSNTKVFGLEQILWLSSLSTGENLQPSARRVGEYAWKREVMVNALKREYKFMTSVHETFQPESWWQRLTGRYSHQPNRTRRLFMESYGAVIDELDEDCSADPHRWETPEEFRWWYLGPNFGGRLIHRISFGSLQRFASIRCEEDMQVGMTRVALALRAYRAHNAYLPERLDALAPDYLDAIPQDLDGEAFRYAVNRQILYSVGEDRLDNGGGNPTFHVDWSADDPGVDLSLRSR